MSATSSTGVGIGHCNKADVRQLAIFDNGPNILMSGIATSVGMSSPPSETGSVTFTEPFENGSDDYVVMLTSLNAGYAYVIDMEENEDGKFIGFSFISESEGEVMYLVVSKGIRAKELT